MKILYVTTVAMTMRFFTSFISKLRNEGHTVDLACNSNEAKNKNEISHIPFSRSPFSRQNLTAYKQVKKLVETNNYDIVHCHTPVAAFITRLACRKARKKGTKVFYTAHGFHFYKGAPLKNWLLYYPAEKLCARFTDLLITINREDYELSQRKFKKAGKIGFVQGVGIEYDKFANAEVDCCAKRNELKIPQDAFVVLSVGELNENKNHETIIKAIAQCKEANIHYIIAGEGLEKGKLQDLVKQIGLDEKVHLLGFRDDVIALYKTADVFIHPSFREGLPVAVMEAMASGLPIIGSNIRGNADLVEEGKNGYLCEPNQLEDFSNKIKNLLENKQLYNDMCRCGKDKAQTYRNEEVHKQMKNLYGI